MSAVASLGRRAVELVVADERLRPAPRTPMANLFRSIAAKEDIELDAFGDSTGALEI